MHIASSIATGCTPHKPCLFPRPPASWPAACRSSHVSAMVPLFSPLATTCGHLMAMPRCRPCGVLHVDHACIPTLRRLVKVDLAAAGPPEEWDDLIPQHQTDLLQWASAHEVSVSQIELFGPKSARLRAYLATSGGELDVPQQFVQV